MKYCPPPVNVPAGRPNVDIHSRNGMSAHAFSFGKAREAQRFLYDVRPQGTGAKEKENDNMAFTREFIRKAAKESGVELPKEFEDALVQEHLSARDAYAAGQVRTALDENKQDPAPAVRDTQEYKGLKKEFEDYKASVTAKEVKTAKETAVRAYYEGKGITGKALDIAMRGSGAEIEALELGEDGKIKDATALDALVAGTFSGLVSTITTKGANTPNPPANNGGGKAAFDTMPLSERMKFANEHPNEAAEYMKT